MDKLSSYVTSYDPVLHVPLYMMAFHISWTYIVGELTGNNSQVDRVWPLLPPMYTAYYAFLPLLPFAPQDIKEAGLNHRVLLMFALQLLWMTRLLYHASRRGFFKWDEEDYRWPILRGIIPAPIYHVFHLVFIAAMQNGILYGLAYPTYLALRNPTTPLGGYDALLAGLSIVDILIEAIADNQQYSFQTFKHSKPRVQKPQSEEPLFVSQRWTEDEANRGFVTRGLWAWSRHPNFTAEQTFWWLQVFFPILTGPGSLDLPSMESILSPSTYASYTAFWSTYAPLEPLWPGIVISMLFLGSTAFTEWITKGKYRVAYTAYQERVGMFWPTGTLFKGLYLQVTGRRRAIDNLVWGSFKATNGVTNGTRNGVNGVKKEL